RPVGQRTQAPGVGPGVDASRRLGNPRGSIHPIPPTVGEWARRVAVGLPRTNQPATAGRTGAATTDRHAPVSGERRAGGPLHAFARVGGDAGRRAGASLVLAVARRAAGLV